MALSDSKIRTAKAKDKLYKLYDEKGLYLEITPAGSKRWRFKYRFEDKEKRISLGLYPEVSLKKARLKRDEVRELLADGVNPSQARKQAAAAKAELNKNTFEAVARDWHAKQQQSWSKGHLQKILAWLEKNIFPFMGSRPIATIESPDLLVVLRRIEARGANDTARRLKAVCGQIFRYAIANSLANRDPSADLKGALTYYYRKKHFSSITDPKEIGALMRAIDSYTGSFIARHALQLAPLVFVRPGELR